MASGKRKIGRELSGRKQSLRGVATHRGGGRRKEEGRGAGAALRLRG